MKVHTKQVLMLIMMSMAMVSFSKRIQTQPADSTNLLQSKVVVETLATESQEAADAHASGDYVPGTPGAPWTEEEVLAVKAKIWKILGMTLVETGDLYGSLLNEGWDESQHHFRKIYMNRMVSTWTRLGFHGSFPDADGSGGSDGCLFWDGIGEVYFDHFMQQNLGHEVKAKHNTAPNFNNGLGPAVTILEAVYKNASFPSQTPVLNKSLFESGKSRADLWAFASTNAVEFGAFLNNMICQYPNFEQDGTYWPDSIESNSWSAKHCNQFSGTPNCTVDLKEGFKFKTGRKDCIPFNLYKKVDDATCPHNLEIKTKKECDAAAVALKLAKDKVTFVVENDISYCKYDVAGQGSYTSLCYMSLDDKYNGGQHSYYVQMPIYDYGKACRHDLAPVSEKECKQAAAYLKLKFDERRIGAAGCFMIDHTFPHIIREWRVHFGEGEYPEKGDNLKGLYPSWATGYGKEVKAVCRYEAEPVQTYMASSWGGGPDSQMNGEITLKYFKDTFDFTRRDTAAILGAHTFGRFHAVSELFRYIWVRNGGSLFNNAYHRNVVGRRDWRFVDPECRHLGDAYGQRGPVRWTVFRRWEEDNKGPVNWMLERYTCLFDCKMPQNLDHVCCQNIPEGGMCTPDNKRANYTYKNDLDPPPDDDDMNWDCEGFNTETGHHEAATPAEMGLYFNFSVNEQGVPYGCPGFAPEHIDRSWNTRDMGCPKNDMPLLEEGNDMKMYQLIEMYADDQAAWVADFVVAWHKMLETGYRNNPELLVEAPLSRKKITCPTQEPVPEELKYWSCFATDDLANHLSEPFLLVSNLDGYFLQVNVSTGKLELSEDATNPQANQKWYIAKTGVMKTLVNGLQHFGVGNYTYDEEHHLLLGAGGLLMRRPNTLHNADLMFVKQPHVSWLSAAWSAVALSEASGLSLSQKPLTHRLAKLPACLALKTSHDKYVGLGSHEVLEASSDSVGVSEQFKVIKNDDDTYSFEAAGGYIVYVDDAGILKALDEGDVSKSKFHLIVNFDGTISLKTLSGNFVSATDTGKLDASKSFDKFHKEVMTNGKVAYKSAYNKYIAEAWTGTIYADRMWNADWAPWNHFEIIEDDDGTISFKTDRGYLWKAEKTGVMDAFEDVIGPYHKFKEIQNNDGTVSLQTADGEFLVASGNGYLFDSKQRAEGPLWENFVPAICALDAIPTNPCPLACESPICTHGSPWNGGINLNKNGKCTAIASQAYGSKRYCGSGASYTIGGFIDCTKCD